MPIELTNKQKLRILTGLLVVLVPVFGLAGSSFVHAQGATGTFTGGGAVLTPGAGAAAGTGGTSAPAAAPQGPNLSTSPGTHTCGNNPSTQVKTKFNFGCLGNNYPGDSLSPIEDVAYAIIRFLSAGVGVVVVISIIMAGIKYSTSEGNPEATQGAKDRIRSTLIGLLVYIFAFALIQFLVPGGAL